MCAETVPTLFCVPPAGATAAMFRGWSALMGDAARVRPVELAGKGARADEPAYADVADAAADVARLVRAEAGPGGWALLGHSMGAVIAYEAARLLPGDGHLVVSGCPPPQCGFGPRWRPDTPDQEIVDFLRSVGDLPEELARNTEAMAYYVGLLRADEALLARHTVLVPDTPLGIPVTVLWGDDDPVTKEHDPERWRETVGRPVSVHTVSGAGHQFITRRAQDCARVLRTELAVRRDPHETRRTGVDGDLLMNTGAQMYLDLMKKVLTNVVYEDPPIPSAWASDTAYDHINRGAGLDWPSTAHTMVGLRRLDNLQDCVERILRDDIPGDLLETGVWRGGTCIFMRGMLRAYEVADRRVWCADSFQGMPEVVAGHPGDVELGTHEFNDVMGVSLDTVKRNFETYGLLDDQVRFLPGWFRDTLPTAPVRRLALLRLDGDLYESTMDALVHLYPKLSVGGFVIVDDYLIDVCREAVHDFRHQHGIHDEIQDIDGYGAFWRRTS
ncbi:alpha/beta fold hydrolase [Actinoallomurus purpureus]|uniref:alpha/beta fold hydrolase n=1 Tax=Actinoallomurus purpureus TaxID=478114 RepID=UPI002092FCE4|nr:alpha/beta fold hydrolase [Actinoallomurus purpureus]MCO6007734.1 alpha/beta fold hydrolase [Actinoallomurus purpureus]